METLYALVLVLTMGTQTSIKVVKEDFPNLESCEKAMNDASRLAPVDKFFGTGKAYYDCRPQQQSE